MGAAARPMDPAPAHRAARATATGKRSAPRTRAEAGSPRGGVVVEGRVSA